MKQKLIFVYNADSGLFNSILDYVHKVISPSTYECNLCALTFGNLGIKKVWKKFIKDLKYQKEFLHRDDFIKEYNLTNVELPVIYIFKHSKLITLVSADEINRLKTLDELMRLITERIETVAKR